MPRLIDRNYGDFLNLFVDVGVMDGVTVRAGGQELLFGAERLISPLDWANTRRTFDGARLLVKEDQWVSDTFYTYVVPVVPNALDEPDYNQTFYGSYNTYTVSESLAVDAYYIGYDDRRLGAGRDFSIHTMGMRLNGALTDNWLFEMEGGPQFGRQSGLGVDQNAGFCTGGLGRKLGGCASLDAHVVGLLRLRLGEQSRRRIQPFQPVVSPCRTSTSASSTRCSALTSRPRTPC